MYHSIDLGIGYSHEWIFKWCISNSILFPVFVKVYVHVPAYFRAQILSIWNKGLYNDEVWLFNKCGWKQIEKWFIWFQVKIWTTQLPCMLNNLFLVSKLQKDDRNNRKSICTNRSWQIDEAKKQEKIVEWKCCIHVMDISI